MRKQSAARIASAIGLTIALAVGAQPCFAATGDEEKTEAGSQVVLTAKVFAMNPHIGYSYSQGAPGHEDDIICYSFVDEVLSRTVKGYGDGWSDSMREQKERLEVAGFTAHPFTGFDDPDLLPGSVIYQGDPYGEDGSPLSQGTRHVELYIGKYSEDKTDILGNPVPDDNGRAVTIGARQWDRKTPAIAYSFVKGGDYDANDDDDPAYAAGDQIQSSPLRWWGGEVSGGWADYRDNHPKFAKQLGDDGEYWGYYYAPENAVAL